MIKLFRGWLNEESGKFEVPHQRFTDLTDAMLKYAKRELNAKGFNAYVSRKASAGVDWTWFQGNPLEKRPHKEPCFILSGWHGSGAYGYGKIVHSVFTQNLPTQPGHHLVIEWRFPHEGDTSRYSNRMGTGYTIEAYDDYVKFLDEVRAKIDETPKLKT